MGREVKGWVLQIKEGDKLGEVVVKLRRREVMLQLIDNNYLSTVSTTA